MFVDERAEVLKIVVDALVAPPDPNVFVEEERLNTALLEAVEVLAQGTPAEPIVEALVAEEFRGMWGLEEKE